MVFVLGKTLSSLALNSVLKSCIPPSLNTGKTAIAITIIPIPPNHCNIALHINIDFGVESKSVIIVAPVVVIPDIDSKNESTNERFGEPKKMEWIQQKLKLSSKEVLKRMPEEFRYLCFYF